MLLFIALCILTYLIGSIPFAYLYGKYIKKIDIREHGSKNVGATNALRVLGTKAGIIVLLLDISKGLLPVILFTTMINSQFTILNSQLAPVMIGICAIIGHTFTVFLKFKGGKGVATSAGVVLALDPLVCLVALLIFAIIVAITRYVSLGSIIASVYLVITKIITYFLFPNPDIYKTIFMAALAILIIIKHKPNIVRLIKREENKISFKKS